MNTNAPGADVHGADVHGADVHGADVHGALAVATAPSTTAPSTTAPSTTAPSTTAPSTTAPSTTAPKPRYIRIIKSGNKNCYTYKYRYRNHYMAGYELIRPFNSVGSITWFICSHIRYAAAAEQQIADLNKLGIHPVVGYTGCTWLDKGVVVPGALLVQAPLVPGVPPAPLVYHPYYANIEAWEYGGLSIAAWLASQPSTAPWYMVTHDTCRVDSLEVMGQHACGDYVSVWKNQFNIGMMRAAWLSGLRNWLLGIDGVSKVEGIKLETGPLGLRGRGLYTVMDGVAKELGYEQLVANGVIRRHVYKLGIHKYYVSGSTEGGKL
jgi:hypothetical protein